jgi:hypothetical protein
MQTAWNRSIDRLQLQCKKEWDENVVVNDAISMVVDSIMEFIDDKSTNGKLLCESQPNFSHGEPVKICQRSFIKDLDPTCRNIYFMGNDIWVTYKQSRWEYSIPR